MPEFDLDTALAQPPDQFAVFVATRKHTASIGTVLQDEELGGLSGFVYMDSLYICDPDRYHGNNYWTIIERSEPSGSLEEMEQELFQWAQEAGVFDA